MKTLLEFLVGLSEDSFKNLTEINEVYPIMRDITNYGLIAFEKLPVKTQFDLIVCYYGIYRK